MARFLTTPTPNPNSLKITRDDGSFIPEGLEAFSSPNEAAGHPLGEPLFEIDGVTNIFIVPQFLTISKAPEVDWAEMWPRIEAVLVDYFGTS